MSPSCKTLTVVCLLSFGETPFAGELGQQVPGDCNQDAVVDVSDASCIFGVLFTGVPALFPCGNGSAADPANLGLLDWQSDGQVDISDGIGLLQFLFVGGPPHPLAVSGMETRGCVALAGCPDNDPCPTRCDPPPEACPKEPRPVVESHFVRGDVDGNGFLEISDAVHIIRWLSLCPGGPPPFCLDAADTDDDGCITLADIGHFPLPGLCPFFELEFCLPAPPFPECGPDPTPDFLGCEGFPCR